jgi:hypothetical protein
MISRAAEEGVAKPLSVPRRKAFLLRPGLWLAVALVFASQVSVVFWLGNPPASAPGQRTAAPMIHLAGKDWQELLSLEDPTLFVLPHRNNFSGAVWVKNTPQPFEPTNTPEPPRPLPLLPEQLGATFAVFMETNPPPRFQTEMGLQSGDLNASHTVSARPIPVPSMLRVEGDLAKRRLLTPFRLPTQTNSDVLNNTIVQVFVDALGNVFSAIVVAGSGNADVDAAALTNFARNARFEPIKAAAPGTRLPNTVTFGKLIFEWQTVPAPPTNSPIPGP